MERPVKALRRLELRQPLDTIDTRDIEEYISQLEYQSSLLESYYSVDRDDSWAV